MQEFLKLQLILADNHTPYEEFEQQLITSEIYQEIYLNLFLTVIVGNTGKSHEFGRYLLLLTTYGQRTKKKSAQVNYVGYKDKISILMHACQKNTVSVVTTLIEAGANNIEAIDQQGRNAAFYSMKNDNQTESNLILTYLFKLCPHLIDSRTILGTNLVFEAIFRARVFTLDMLLIRGVELDGQLASNGNTPVHEAIRLYSSKQQQLRRVLLTLMRFKPNLLLANFQGLDARQYARKYQANLQELISYVPLKTASLQVLGMPWQDDNDQSQFDKKSFTCYETTKFGDSASSYSERQFVEISYPYQQSIDISESDTQYQQSLAISSGDEASIQSESEQKSEQYNDFDDDAFVDAKDINYERLSAEILALQANCENTHRKCWQQIAPFLDKLAELADKYDLGVEIIGSFASGLWFPYCDIDIALVPNTDVYIDFEATLDKIFRKLRRDKQLYWISNIVINKYSKINWIKLEMNHDFDYRKIDISIFHKKNSCKIYASYIGTLLTQFPQIKTLFMIYKTLLEVFQLHDQATGGLKTYALFLMIYTVVKSLPTRNIGELFYHIAMYFGFYFEYGYDFKGNFKNLKCEAEPFSEMRLDLIDPLNSKNNVGGKNMRTKELESMFRSIFYALHIKISGSMLNYLKQLPRIL